jgi:hypothetical protein
MGMRVRVEGVECPKELTTRGSENTVEARIIPERRSWNGRVTDGMK